MQNNELSTVERLDVALQSHKFYHQQCIEMEERINGKVNSIFQTSETGTEPSKKDVKVTIALVSKLLALSNRFIQEAMCVINELDNLTKEEKEELKEEDFAKKMKNQLVYLNDKQVRIHDRVQEIQQVLMEMYNIDEDTF